MIEFIIKYWLEVLFGLITFTVSCICKILLKKNKEYHRLLQEKELDDNDELIEKHLVPVLQEIEELRDYIRKVDIDQQQRLSLLISSYKYRLVQLCKLYLNQGYISPEQYEQLTEFYKVYVGLGGNGQAKQYYEKTIRLPIEEK